MEKERFLEAVQFYNPPRHPEINSQILHIHLAVKFEPFSLFYATNLLPHWGCGKKKEKGKGKSNCCKLAHY